MKFTEGYWEQSEKAHGLYPMQAYEVEKIPGGMRVTAPCRQIANRGAALNTTVLTVEFRAVGENVISFRAAHFEGYESGEPRFEKKESLQPVEVEISEEEAVMRSGKLTVRVNRKNWGYQYEAEGRVLTTSGFRNLGYLKYNRQESTLLPGENYLREDYEPYLVSELSLQQGECVYGLGERFTAFVKNGQTVDMWNEDGGTATQVSYKNIPFYMTNKGYGVFVDHTDRVSFEVASEKVEYVGVSVPGEELRYCFLYGETPKEILQSYGELLGKPALPPAWSFGLWLSTSFTTNYDEETVTSFIRGMEERDIPLSVFHFDCFWMKEFQWCDFEWDARVFPDVENMLERYHQKGLKICVWINPYIAQKSSLFEEGRKKGYFLKRPDGKGVYQIDRWQAGMAFVDFTNPEACRWYRSKLRRLLDMGVDCFKTDFGERIPADAVYSDGSNPMAMHNYYTFLYNQCVFELLREVKGEESAVVFARSATAGGQKFPVHWGGDCSASYPSMAETLRGGLSLALSGFSFWSHDISGFENTATADLYKRWAAFGMLSTHSRLHGSKSYRVPWMFDEESSLVLRHFTKWKCRLMPYLFAKAIEAHETGIPVMRPMMLEFPEDLAVTYLDTQYLLGESLLAAPILNENSLAEYYLPEGTWTHLFSGEVREGGRWFRERYDYFSLPLYVRENTLLAMGKVDTRPDYDYGDGTELHLYMLQDGKEAVCRIPDTHGRIVNTVRAVRNGRQICIQAEQLRDGMCYVLKQREKIVQAENAVLTWEDGKQKVIPEGKTTVIILEE